jgi:hypothetical protein
MASTVLSSQHQQFNSNKKFFLIAGTALAQPILSCNKKFGSSPLMMFTMRPLIDPQCNFSQDGIKNGPLLAAVQ